jgi:hypothetical protein
VLAFLNGLLVCGVTILKISVGGDPCSGVCFRQLGKFGLVSDKLRLQAPEYHVQMVGVMTTLRLDLLPFGLRYALGFRDLCRLAPVIGVFHVPGFQLRLLDFDLAKVDFRVFVFLRFLRLYRGLLAFLLRSYLFGLLGFLCAFLRGLDLFLDLFPARGQEVHRRIV